MPRKLAALCLCLLAFPSPVGATDFGRLAFTTDRDGNNEIYSALIDGWGPTNLSNNPAVDQLPAWSADGSRIAFVSDRDGRMDIWVMNWDGSDQHRITSGDSSSSDSHPTWSPDGGKIAFSSSRSGSWSLWVVDLGDGSLMQLTSGWGVSPAWSPNGSRIAYDGGGEIRVVDASGGNDHQVTFCVCTGPAGSPAWSPDGSWIYFGRYDEDWQATNVRQLYIMPADGGASFPVTSGAYFYDHPTLGPPGVMLFQRQEGASGNPEIYLMAGTTTYPSVTGPGRNFAPAWGPTFRPPPDTTPPTITITRPTANTDRIDVYTVGQVVLANYTCTDTESGIRHCQGSVPSGEPIDTRFIGTYEFIVFAADQAGNPVYARTRYRVIYPFNGFFAPVTSGLTDFKAGDGAPMKFSLGADYGLDVLIDATATQIDCATGARTGATIPAAGSFTYNGSLDRYMKVWTTEKSAVGSCFAVELSLRDGTRHEADFRLTK